MNKVPIPQPISVYTKPTVYNPLPFSPSPRVVESADFCRIFQDFARRAPWPDPRENPE